VNRREKTTIEVSKQTRDLLKKIGKKGETYDDIIRRLLKVVYGERLNEESPPR